MEWKLLRSPASGHQRHGWHGENRGVGGDFYSCGAEVALRNPPDVSPERPGLRAVCGVLSPPWLFRMAWGLWGLCPQGSLLVFRAAFVFGTEAGVQLSPVFVPAGALGHGIRLIPATLGLGRPVWPVVMILGIKSSSLAGRPILLVSWCRLVRGLGRAGETASHFWVCCFALGGLVVIGRFSGKVALFSRGHWVCIQQRQQGGAGGP